MNHCIYICRYNYPIERLVNNFNGFNGDVKYYVFDNSDIQLSSTDVAILSTLRNNDNFVYISSNGENKGLSFAINTLNQKSLADGFTHAIYFDQDSIADSDLILNLVSRFRLVPENTFCIGPMPIDSNGEKYHVRYNNKPYIDNLHVANELITSGMLFSIALCQQLGGFDDKLFLDMVDFEVCWRARRQGYLVFVATDIHMVHQVGERHINFLGRKLPVSSPIRNYYQTRNNLYIFLSGHYSTSYAAYMFSRRLVNIMINLIFADNRLQRCKFNIEGIIDAVKGNMGKYSN